MRTGAANGDLVFFGADREKVVNDALGALRAKVGHDRGFAQPGWKPLWVIDFPMFEFDDDKKTWAARHHPFTAPKDGHEDLFTTDPANTLAKAYDVVLNGWRWAADRCAFTSPTYSRKCLRHWAFPGGPAEEIRLPPEPLQVARRTAACLRSRPHRDDDVRRRIDSRRDCVPKTQRADLLVDAPPADRQQLRDLHIKISLDGKLA